MVTLPTRLLERMTLSHTHAHIYALTHTHTHTYTYIHTHAQMETTLASARVSPSTVALPMRLLERMTLSHTHTYIHTHRWRLPWRQHGYPPRRLPCLRDGLGQRRPFPRRAGSYSGPSSRKTPTLCVAVGIAVCVAECGAECGASCHSRCCCSSCV